jgi:hypothetical protein
LGYGNIFETPSERDKKAVRNAESAFQGNSMIKKDHKGLYLCPPNRHSEQSHIINKGTSSKERKDLSASEERTEGAYKDRNV